MDTPRDRLRRRIGHLRARTGFADPAALRAQGPGARHRARAVGARAGACAGRRGPVAGAHASRLDGSPLRYNRRDPRLPDLLVCRKGLEETLREEIARLEW
ncbi:hypothetical protein [Streptomyces sp. NBC_00868]|uniref:hypothetical protein n=1 Tax=Streptomyces sp. NBC_00868 TaxID=2903683 RepID=UPI003867534A